ncbi:uncharacterized protein BDW47DRAFT_126134 [Aspergillus candidus]|uniref:Uncharacterized protein n=1 Tax=Aspergillus candidus TaxID=41067 RepID=A0A2I2FAM6_ASPCN|nr:hypothetical protein BDW47DRAFT_126134 [Aspergillus candidus]PLB37674.1 hypothetical protein BDW47DRAFT_126134 [Aspergillus candidus]
MATLTVATKANGALTLPGVLAAAYLSAGNSAIDSSVTPFLVDYASSTPVSKRSQINEWIQQSTALSAIHSLTIADIVSGWDDPRMPTVRGIRRRAMTVPALRELILKQGPSQNIVNLDWTAFWAMNKKYIDPVAPRHTAIVSLNAAVASVEGVMETTSEKHRHNNSASLGTNKVFFDKEILLAQDDAASLKPDEEFTHAHELGQRHRHFYHY